MGLGLLGKFLIVLLFLLFWRANVVDSIYLHVVGSVILIIAEGFKKVFGGYWLHLIGFFLLLPSWRLGGFHLGEPVAIKVSWWSGHWPWRRIGSAWWWAVVFFVM